VPLAHLKILVVECTSDQRPCVLKLPCEATPSYVLSCRCSHVCGDILRAPGLESWFDQIEWVADYDAHGAGDVARPKVGRHCRNGMEKLGIHELVEGHFGNVGMWGAAMAEARCSW
jgi:hypothetical protein